MTNYNLVQKNKKENGFTIIEMLVVTLILVLITVALAAIIKGLITSSTRIKRLQTVRAQTQEAIHYLTKELRMSEFTGCNSDTISFDWRKASNDDDYYTIEPVTLNKGSIDSFFPEDWANIQTDSFQFKASGTTIKGNEGDYKNNRIVIKFNVKVFTSATNDETTEEIIIPIQTMVSLRSYNLQDEE